MGIMHYSNEYTAILWFRDNKRHNTFRENGPCQINESGAIFFSQLESYYTNRKRGPAIIRPDGEIVYKDQNGQFHRTDGPALIFADGSCQYWVNGNSVLENEFFLRYGAL